MFMAHGKDGILSAEEDPEKIHLLEPQQSTSSIYEYEKVSPMRRYLRGDLKIPKTQAIAGILLGLLLVAMILVLVAEAIRETDRPNPFLLNTQKKLPPVTISLLGQDFADAWTQGEGLAAYRRNLELTLFENGLIPKKGTPSSLLQRFQSGNVDVDTMMDCGIIVEHMKRVLGGCIDSALLPDYCRPSTPNNCSSSYPYRTFNGSCNNLEHADWGMALTAFKRLRRPIYADGVASPRISISGEELPNARYLSNELYTHHSRPRSNCTVLTLYFGLFIDHDIIRIGSKTGHKGASISCCDPKVLNDSALLHPECMPILVPENDPFYGPLGVKCLDFVRSAPVPGECPGQREQMNLVTSFLDASGVYGSFDDANKALRSHKNGLLNVCWINNTAMLPQGHHISYECGFPNRNLYCFRAGDMRVNEQVELTAIHTMWMREHNRVALRLHSINPQWDDERLFQEARRVVIAELQHMAFNEFLPVLLGEDVVKEHNLTIDPQRGYEGYNPNADPSIYNVFGAAAFRVGHSLIELLNTDVTDYVRDLYREFIHEYCIVGIHIQRHTGKLRISPKSVTLVLEGTLELIGTGYSKERQIPLHTVFLNPHIFYEKGFDLLLRGLVREKTQSVDSYITDEVRNRLFQPHNGRYGMDLSAIGIQRGRDQGIPGYVEWRKFCNLPDVSNWEDLFQFMDSAHVQRLSKVYNFVEDIDLIPAALSENHLPGALVGPTHACLIARQFHQMRIGDRFWFEAQNQPGSFSPGQLEQIYKSSLARLLCDNSDDIEEIQKVALRPVSSENPAVNCSEIPYVDLKVWSESS